MKRRLSKRLSIMRTPFKSSIPSVWELLPDYTPCHSRGDAVGLGTLW